MQSLNSSDEKKLLDGVKTAVSLVDNEGMSPNDALKKVAEEYQYSPGFLKSACNAFNNGRQLAQWNANDSVLDKLASFPLADYDAIHDSLWGGEQEKAASVSHTSPRFNTYAESYKQDLLNLDLSSFEKAASDQQEEVHPLVADEHATIKSAKVHAQAEYARRKVEECRRVKTAAEDKLNFKVHLVENYFKKFAYDRLPFAQVDHGVSVYYGEAGKALMDHVAGSFPSEKRASDHQATWEGFGKAVDRTKEPYTLVADCIKQANDLFKAVEALDAAKAESKQAEETLAPFTQAPHANPSGNQSILTPSLMSEDGGQKEASILGGLAGGAGLGIAKSIGEAANEGAPKEIENQINELDSPEHLNEMRKIRAQTVLTQLLSDPDNPLSGYDPEEVLTAYNDLIQLSPRLADQPSAIAPLLNKRLMGNTEPFEVGEQLKLEQGLKQVQDSGEKRSPTDLMNNEASIIS